MKPADRLEELESLLLDWEDGTLDDAGIERVRELLRSDEEARAHYVRLQMMNAALELEDEAGLMPAGSSWIRKNSDSTTAEELNSCESSSG